MNILLLISLILITTSIILILLSFLLKDSYTYKLNYRDSYKFAILIPAKDESKVIRNLLDSINKQVSNMKDTYIIVESLDDKTCEIAKEYKAKIILRKDLSKQRKGYALDEAIKEIIHKQYDFYFIFDADNILEDGFIDEMIKTYKEGYDIGVGYRNVKNSDSLVALASGTTFTVIDWLNKIKNRLKKVIVISGTGFYISSNVINKLDGYPFHSLTEDYELSLYAKLNNISTYYNEKAIFYDEQPTKLGVSIKQRTRWVKGFLEARKNQLKNNTSFKYKIGIIPYLLIILGIIVYFINCLFNIKQLFVTILLVYLLLFIPTLFILIKDKRINISNMDKIKAALFNPIFLFTYLICFIKAITTKDLKWEKINHQEELKKIKN